jgi:MFS superfamily sulfate permease-like transporter
MKFNTSFLKSDLLAGAVVFLVALPLCLGIALASGAPLFSGIVAGVIGGIIVGIFSGSELSVSGPAAGLTAIVLAAITSLGNFETFLVAVILAGVIQILLGLIKAGTISNYFPSNVIEGMLTAIGIIIILKQLPHAVGYDKDLEGDEAFEEAATGQNTFTSLFNALDDIQLGAVIITLVSLAILIAFNKVPFLKNLKAVPGALVAVIVGIALNEVFKMTGSSLAIEQEHLVNLPVADSLGALWSQLPRPDFSTIMRPDVWLMAGTIAVVASIETLLCIEAADKMDTMKRYSNTNQELFAQGAGNIVSGLLGGLPMTSVIVRTSANVNSGARTRIAAIAHGVFLLVAVIAIPSLLNKIPLATLAAILLMIGWKLASPSVFKHMWRAGSYQFIPFIITVVAVVFTDLLKGVGIGLIVSIVYILRANLKLAYFFDRKQYHDGETIELKLAQEVSFLNKAAIKQTLRHLPEQSKLHIDASETFYIDHDVVELIKDFIKIGAKDKNIKVTISGFKDEYKMNDALKHVVSHT